MKYFKFGLSLFIFACFSSAGFCDLSEVQNSLGTKLNLQDASSVTAQANKNSSFGPSYVNDNPMLNATLNSMMQVPGLVSPFNAQEQLKQQADYTKQQTNYTKD